MQRYLFINISDGTSPFRLNAPKNTGALKLAEHIVSN